MNRAGRSRALLTRGAAILAALVVLLSCTSAVEPPRENLIAAPQVEGFARVEGPSDLAFPLDHGPHPDYQTEWWYYTGNVQTEAGRHFGYQLTFFRRALIPDSRRVQRASSWATNQAYMAHLALSDPDGGEHLAFERFGRGAAGLAGAQSSPFRVWLEDWSVQDLDGNRLQLKASAGDLVLDLTLSDDKGITLHGDGGYSRKGPQPENASYYYSQSRLTTQGFIQLSSRRFEVSGLSWMDHEWTSGGLSGDQVGWDWFSLQLSDGSDLMLFQIRKSDGSIEPYSSGTLIEPDGSTLHLSREDFLLEVLSTWRSNQSGATYPDRWRLEVVPAGLALDISPRLPDQELNVSTIYWEGTVQATGSRNGRALAGDGYIELTGYARPLQALF